MSTKSFNKNFKIDPTVAEDFMDNLILFPKETKEESILIKKNIIKNKNKVENLLAKFSSLQKN